MIKLKMQKNKFIKESFLIYDFQKNMNYFRTERDNLNEKRKFDIDNSRIS